MRETIGQWVAQRRRGAGWTQEQLGAHLGISKQAVSGKELGARRFSVPEMLELFRLFDIPAGEQHSLWRLHAADEGAANGAA